MNAPPQKTSNPRLNQPPSLVLHRNLRLTRHHADRVSSKALRKENTKKQTMPTAVHQKKGKGKKQRAPRAHRGQHCGPRKPTAPNRAVGKKRCRKAMASFQKCAGRQNKTRSSYLPLWKRGFIFAVQLTLLFMISRSARSPQEHYSRSWASGSTSAPPFSALHLHRKKHAAF